MKKFMRGVIICSALLLLIPAGVANAQFPGGHGSGGPGGHGGHGPGGHGGHGPGSPGGHGPGGHGFGGHGPGGFGGHGQGGPDFGGHGFGHPFNPIGHAIGGGLHILGHGIGGGLHALGYGLNLLNPFHYGSPYGYQGYRGYQYSNGCSQIIGLASRGVVPPGVPPEHFFRQVSLCGGGFGPSYYPPAAGVPFAPVPAPGAY